MSLTDHIKRVKENQAKKRSNTSNFANDGESIWHKWEPGDQTVRFSGDFIQTKVHYIGNNAVQNSVKLFGDDAFAGDNRIPKSVNCANWDIDKEERKDGGCIICRLNKIAREVLKSDDSDAMDDATKKEFKDLKSRTDDRSSYRWNIIDRDKNGKGFKIASIGQELFEELANIYEDYSPADFTSDDEGVDIKVSRSGGKNERVKYRASLILEGGKVKVTPLTDEEKSWSRHNLMEMCGRQVDQEDVREKLDSKWSQLIEAYEEGDSDTKDTTEDTTQEATKEKAENKKAPF